MMISAIVLAVMRPGSAYPLQARTPRNPLNRFRQSV
jgi:hypothetical protein